MIFETYPARYRDRFGEVTTTIDNDGKELRLMLRDVAFTISNLEALEPDPRIEAAQLARFAFSPKWGCVWDYTLEFDLPLPVFFRKEPLQGVLHVHLTIEADPLKGIPGRELLLLRLDAAGASFASQGQENRAYGTFEEAFLDIQRQFPEDLYIQMCFCCAYSDYSPLGNNSFGGMDCYRGTRQRYLAVKTKRDILGLTPTEIVQETYRCGEFERRQPGTGYRG